MTIRLRAKTPSWDLYDIANASTHTIASITSVDGTPLKVFETSSIPFNPFSGTMPYIKKMTGAALAIGAIALATYDKLPTKYKIDTVANPSYSGQTGYLFVYFDYDGFPYALGFYVSGCEG